MNFFHKSFRKPSALVASSAAAATCLYYVANEEKANFFEAAARENNAETQAIWNFVPTTTTTQCLSLFKKTQTERPHLLFLGTGSSTGCPKPLCAMKFKDKLPNYDKSKSPDPGDCRISHLALAGGDPKSNKNYRNNPCLLVHHYDEDSNEYKNILIDVGKTFRETALRWFPIRGIKTLDAIILTHHHMDAAAGLDDVRGFQERRQTRATPLYLSDFCHLNLQNQFPWLLPSDRAMPQQDKNRPEVKRHVASFDATIFHDYKEEVIDGFKFTPLPVWHGDDLISHGFAFTIQPGPKSKSEPLHVVYLSDISRMVPETMEYIQTMLPPTDILIVDSLLWERAHPVHYSMKQAVELSQVIKPRLQTYLIGMSCDNFLPHDEMNKYLKEKYGTSKRDKKLGAIAFAHDGLVVELPKK